MAKKSSRNDKRYKSASKKKRFRYSENRDCASMKPLNIYAQIIDDVNGPTLVATLL